MAQGDDNISDWGLDPIILEAQKRFQACKEWESNTRRIYIDDLKFVEADSVNGYQWPNSIRQNREIDKRPCLTINKTRQHCLQIINDAAQNKPEIKVRGVGNGATFESARVYQALIRHILYQSNGGSIIDTATNFQVKCGIGYWRIKTDYANEKSFNQEIYLVRVPDPLTIYMDQNAKEADKSDAKFAFVFEDIPKEQFDKEYPELKDRGAASGVLGEPSDWVTKDHVKRVEYYRIVEDEDTLYLVESAESLEGEPILKSEMPKNILEKLLLEKPDIRSRPVKRRSVEYYFIVGSTILEKKVWIGKDIPIVPVLGEETVIAGIMDRKGHTRAMLDCQRMYNYWSSSGVEYGALQTKTPWLASAQSIEGYETYWNNANIQNQSVLPYNAFDENGQPIPPPTRIEPPVAAPVSMAGMEVSAREMEMVSGQYQAQMGAPSNERSGRAINERQRQGDRAVYHYINNLGVSIGRTGKIILDLISKVYDTQQVLTILAEDGTDLEITIDPTAKQAYQQQLDQDNKVVQRILNPKIGRYEVVADIGPAYATRREEAFNALTLILTQAPELANVVADFLFKAGDFEFADQIAERLRRMVPPQALGQGPTQQEQVLQQQVQVLTTELHKQQIEAETARLKLHSKEQQKDIDVFKALTERLRVLGDQQIKGLELAQIMQETVQEASQQTLEPVVRTAEKSMADQYQLPLGDLDKVPPMLGAKRAPDGKWYIEDRTRPGKYVRVEK